MAMAQPMAPKKDYMYEVRERGISLGCVLLMGSISLGFERVTYGVHGTVRGQLKLVMIVAGELGACLPAVHVGKESGIHDDGDDGFGMTM